MPSIKFYTDEHVSRAVVAGLRNRGADVFTVQEAGTRGEADTAHLDRARAEGRVVFTQDADFLRLHSSGVKHAGIVFAKQGISVGETVRGLILIHQLMQAEDMVGKVEYL